VRGRRSPKDCVPSVEKFADGEITQARNLAIKLLPV
jgi:hypothetical protein